MEKKKILNEIKEIKKSQKISQIKEIVKKKKETFTKKKKISLN